MNDVAPAREPGVPGPSGGHVGDLLAGYRDADVAGDDVLRIVEAFGAEAGITVRGAAAGATEGS